MDLNTEKIFKILNPNRIWIPVLFGLAIVFYLFYSDDRVTLSNLRLITDADLPFLLLAIFIIVARAFGYIYRLRVVSNESLSWTSCLYVIILWEFASAVTPSVVGGTAVAVFILLMEGISFGKSLAYVMLTAIFDNLFLIVSAPLIIIFSQGEMFPEIEITQLGLENSLEYLFYLSLLLIAVYTCIMAYALLFQPRAFKWFMLKLTSIRFLRKWRHDAAEHGDEIILASAQLNGKDWKYWFNVSWSTIFIWSVRYLQLNLLIAAFTDVSIANHFLIFARQIILWIVMLISPTPGSSGTAEFFFNPFFIEFLANYTFITNILWRLLSFYPYLIFGAIFLPRWIRRVFFKKKGSPKLREELQERI